MPPGIVRDTEHKHDGDGPDARTAEVASGDTPDTSYLPSYTLGRDGTIDNDEVELVRDRSQAGYQGEH